MTLTPDQSIAEEFIINFVKSLAKEPEDYFCTLSGFAGTGKTTVMNSIIQKIRHGKKIAVSAPTHKAKEVIAKVTKQNAETIQSLLGLRPNIELTDFNPNKPIFEVLAEERIMNYNIIIIDEASMLGKALVDQLKTKAVLYRTKIIFMGDIYQLPPVGEVCSTVFNLKHMTKLETIVRQSDSNPNQKLIELARNDVRDGTDTCIPYLMNIQMDMNGKEGFKRFDQKEWYEGLLEKYYDSEYKENPDFVKTIAWKNITVGSINRYLRKNIIESDELVAVGDLLMGYKNISKTLNEYPFFIPIVKNSYDYKVTKVVIDEVKIMGVMFKGYKTWTKEGELPMFILHRDSYPDFVVAFNERLYKAKEFKQWKSYYTFKEQIILLENVSDDYGNHVCDKDIDYGYCITVHKSQGSTYKNVGICLKDILLNRTPQERRQLIYVAASRVSEENLCYV